MVFAVVAVVAVVQWLSWLCVVLLSVKVIYIKRDPSNYKGTLLHNRTSSSERKFSDSSARNTGSFQYHFVESDFTLF